MSAETTQDRLIRVLNDSMPHALDARTVTPVTALNSFGVDSLVLIDLIFDLEQEFGVKLAAEDLMNMRTVGDLTAFIDAREGK
jgi:acyl carrier protein